MSTLKQKIKGKIFVMVSDGECQEGTTWESFLIASKHKLDNLVVVVDYNKIQALSKLKDALPLDNLSSKFRAFNCNCIEIKDGHSFKDLIKGFKKIKNSYSQRVKTYKNINEIKDTKIYDIVVLAVKPQIVEEVMKDFKNFYFKKNVVVISIIAGKKIFFFKNIKGEIFNVSDNLPASSEKVYKYAANVLKVKSFKVISTKNIESKMLKSFYRDSKKVSNKKLKKKLKFKLKYPTYKKGLSDFIN